ncbi:putative Heat shock chaperonin-binding, tetratricopeptide-like helical domain superfamily [Helianthus annuus]|nr:putative Heat shock chaperonin-binding, tetratricopeptide-like helical domain superfamily [Helianthus annuus]
MADEAKAKGNAAFSAGNFTDAIKHFTDAINLAPSNHVLYSNRSAAHASLNQYSDALSDAKGLEVDPNNETLKSGLADAESAQSASYRSREARESRAPMNNLFGDAFGPDMWAKLTADPATRLYMQQPDFVNKMKELQRNPSGLNLYLQDQRVMQALTVLLNVKMQANGSGPSGDDMEMPGSPPRPADEVVREKEAVKEPEPEPEPMEVSGEEREVKERKARAQKEKEAGNAAYKKKDFETAIACYTKAVELDDGDISFLTNRAAVYLEMGKYDECIKDCEKAVERGRELRSDYKMVARALTRKGTALVKMAKTSKDYEPAIETFQKALTEHRNPDTLKKLNEAERAKKELEQQEYYDPELAEKEREKGNKCFKEQKYPDAIKHYTEALRRNPKDAKAYSNRAACYTKLGAMPEGLKDAEKCIEIDPKFSKGYTRKGAIQFFMKEYDKALETYQEGLKHDPQNHELLEGVRSCVQQINRASRGDLTPDELKERQAKAMQDPEIQNILTDPVMAQVLKDLQENPKAAQDHMKNPSVMNKIQKLISAGIVQMR